MNVVLVGATGHAGRTLLAELISRGHKVSAVARDPSKIPVNKLVTAFQDDLSDSSKLAELAAKADAVVSAIGVPSDSPDTDMLVTLSERVIAAVHASTKSRLLVVGGCGSLYFSPGVTVLDSGHWPAAYVPIAKSHMKLLATLKASAINWTYVSPPMLISMGERTGKYRLGKDDLIVDGNGKSWISFEDYAIAVVDELESPAHESMRMSVAY